MDGFWQLVPPPGGTPSLRAWQRFARADHEITPGDLRGFRRQPVERLLTDPHSRHQLREALVARYFPAKRLQLTAIADDLPTNLQKGRRSA